MITVTNGANSIAIGSTDGTVVSYLVKSDIAKVDGYFQANTTNGLGGSPYSYGKRTPGRTTKTIVTITMHDSQIYSFDCDEVQNQVTWQGCQNANLLQAIADINSWL